MMTTSSKYSHPCGGDRENMKNWTMTMSLLHPFPLVFAITALLLSSHNTVITACTDILMTPGASADGSAMIAYNADSPTLFGVLYHYPKTKKNATTTTTRMTKKQQLRKVYDWDSGVYLGEIDESHVHETYNVVGNANEHGLVIGESTFGGVAVLAGTPQTDAILDYGSLIYITLQRAKTCREAIRIMSSLLDEYGYYSAGESFSLADATTGEVWIMEVIGRGNDYYYDSDSGKKKKKGAVWVAIQIPDGAVAAHANQARITTFPRNDPDHCLYADDVVDVAVHYGLYPATANPNDFSFSDVYDPGKLLFFLVLFLAPCCCCLCSCSRPHHVSLFLPPPTDSLSCHFSFGIIIESHETADFLTTRHGDARVWSIFSKIVDTTGTFESSFQSYAMGQDLTHRMPLYVIPFKKLAVDDVMRLLASHYEHTSLDSSLDVGAGLFETPYRPRPLVWTLDDDDADADDNEIQNGAPKQQYHNERSVATAKTGWTFVAQVRPYMPAPLSALIWFACDDSSTVPRTPVYASSTAIAPPYAGSGSQDGAFSPLLDFDLGKAFWVQNMVSNFAYYRWSDVYPVLRQRIDSIQQDFMAKVTMADERALELYKDGSSAQDVENAIQFVTQFSVNAGNKLHQDWIQFYGTF
jgi:dipeptidase